MTKTLATGPAKTGPLWPWTAGALVLGVPLSILMPPLALILIVALGGWGLTQRGHQSMLSRRALAVALGLAVVGLVYLLAWAATG